MARCAVFKCINGRIKKGLQRTEKVVYHKFPRDPKFASLWWQATKRRRSQPCKSDFICSEHFLNDSYIRDLQHELLGLPPRKRLKEDAVPKLKLPSVPQGAVKRNQDNVAGPKKKRGRPKIIPNEKRFKEEKVIDEYLKNEATEIYSPPDLNISSEREMQTQLRRTSYDGLSDVEEFSATICEEKTSNTSCSEDSVQRLQNDLHCQMLLRNMFIDDALMDVVLIAEERTVKAHRAVLRQASGYFKQLLSVDLTVESEITLRDIVYEDLVKIIGFIYLGEVSIRSSNLCRFLKTAEKLEIFSLLPWSEDTEESVRECIKEKVPLEELRVTEFFPDRHTRSMNNLNPPSDNYGCDGGLGENAERHRLTDFSPFSLDKRRESFPVHPPVEMEGESQSDFDAPSRPPLQQFAELFSKNYSPVMQESDRGSLHMETLNSFGSENPSDHYTNASGFPLAPSFHDQTLIHQL